MMDIEENSAKFNLHSKYSLFDNQFLAIAKLTVGFIDDGYRRKQCKI